MNRNKILAHKILFEDKEYRMSIAEISTDRHSVLIVPFVAEEANTRFVSGTVAVEIGVDEEGCYFFLREL